MAFIEAGTDPIEQRRQALFRRAEQSAMDAAKLITDQNKERERIEREEALQRRKDQLALAKETGIIPIQTLREIAGPMEEQPAPQAPPAQPIQQPIPQQAEIPAQAQLPGELPQVPITHPGQIAPTPQVIPQPIPGSQQPVQIPAQAPQIAQAPTEQLPFGAQAIPGQPGFARLPRGGVDNAVKVNPVQENQNLLKLALENPDFTISQLRSAFPNSTVSDVAILSAQRGGTTKRDIEKAKRDFDEKFKGREEVDKLRKEVSGLRTTKDLQIVDAASKKVEAAAKDPSAAGDLALVFNYMKILDPNSVVRESEFANAQNATGVNERVRNIWNRILSGERLAPEQRADFLAQAKGQALAQFSTYEESLEPILNTLDSRNIDRRKVIPSFRSLERLRRRSQGGVSDSQIEKYAKQHNLSVGEAREIIKARVRGKK